jgi:hypothetical protein
MQSQIQRIVRWNGVLAITNIEVTPCYHKIATSSARLMRGIRENRSVQMDPDHTTLRFIQGKL